MSFYSPTQDDVMLLMKELRDQDVKVFLDADTVRVRAPKAGIGAPLKEKLRTHKKELIAFLRSAGNGDAAAIRIPARAPGTPVVLSFLQRKLWLIDQITGGSIHYNMSMSMRVEGELDIENLRRTFETIVERHESLRTTFHADAKGEPHQVVAERFRFELPVTDLSGLPCAQRELRADAERRAEENVAFDLAADLMLRARLVRLGAGSYLLLATKHHIASDGWSMDVFMNELCRIYEANALGKPHGLAPLPIQYGDYALWMRDWLRGPVLERQADYWTRQLADLPVLHRLPLDRPRPKAQTMNGARLARRYPVLHSERLEALAREHEVTLFMLLQSLFAVFLSKWSGEDDVVMGTPISSRFKPELTNLIGFFTNTLVLRSRCDADLRFADFLRASKTMLLDAHEYQHIPFETLIDILNPARDLAYNPLVQIVFALQNNEAATVDRLRLPGVEIFELPPNGNVNVKFDLELAMLESPDGLLAKWTYNTDLFDAATVERMALHFEFLIESVLADASLPLRRLSLPPAQQAMIAAWNDTAVPYPARPVHEAFAAQACLTPDAPAVRCGAATLTYAQLDRRAGALAARLRVSGAGAGARVGLCMQNSVELMTAMLAILKSGAAYVPLDPLHPGERLARIATDAGLRVVLTQRHLAAGLAGLSELGVAVMAVDETVVDAPAADEPALDAPAVDAPAVDAPARAIPADSAYVIYTSGSTGQPKGVVVSHRSLSIYLDHALRTYYAGAPGAPLAGSLVATSFAFDLTKPALFLPLMSGGVVELLEAGDPLGGLARRIADADGGNRLVRATPMHMQAMLDLMADQVEVPARHAFVIGGDSFTPALARRLRRRFPRAVIYNHYGPSESVVGCAMYELPAHLDGIGDLVPIGRAMSNTALHVLDERLQPCPLGVPGELYVGGEGLADGYLGQPELTARGFVDDPFAARSPGMAVPARMYRTGDRVRYDAAGDLLFLGRADDQIKLRGYRVEPGEIEASLRRLPFVRDAVVAAKGDGDDIALVGYLVLADDAAVARVAADAEDFAAQATAALRLRLPEYMVPSAFVLLDALPLSANGKVDRARLPAPARRAATRCVALEGDTEQRLGRIWREVLGVAAVGATDSFFELGGHSLKATRMVSAIGAEFGVALPLVTVFAEQRLRGLALQIERLGVNEHNSAALATLDATNEMEW